MKTKVLIVGAGSQAKYVIDIFALLNTIEISGIVDVENSEISNKKLMDYEVNTTLDEIEKNPKLDNKIIVAYSNNKKKEELVERLSKVGYEFINCIHPSVYISPKAKIGNGNIINANVSVMPLATIGNHTIVHSNSLIEHDNQIHDFVNLGPAVTLAGYVTIKKRAYIHSGAIIIPSITIGEDAIVGAGSTVLKDVPEDVTVVGSPAKIK